MLRIIAAVVSCVLLAGLCLAVETHAMTSYFDVGDKIEKESEEEAKYLTQEERACRSDGKIIPFIVSQRNSGIGVTDAVLWWRKLLSAVYAGDAAVQHHTDLILMVYQQPHPPAAALAAKVEIDCLSRAHHETDSVPTTAAPLR